MSFKEGGIIAEHYQLKKQLGQGSFGDVWLAHNLLADIDVAIKFYGTLDQKGIEDFRNEFRIAYRLRHPNLLNINHFDVFENCPYLVMPFCENGSANQYVGHMPESEIWRFILDVSCGLAFLHSQQPNIVHQDIKPANILITSDGRYVISDFGISRSFRTQMSRTFNNSDSSGTIAYMGPERFSEKPMVVLASDIWAFGMTIYELLTGDVLWEGMGGCVQLNGARIPEISGVSPELANLICSCLAAETWNRPTAQQIHEYAAAKIQHKTLPPLPTSGIKNVPQQDSKREEATYIPPKKPVTPTVRKRLFTVAAACLAVILIGGGFTIYRNSIGEEQDFLSCKTKEDFEQFIKEHPSSSYVETAQKRIKALTPVEQQPEAIMPVAGNLLQTNKTHSPATTVPVVRERVEVIETPPSRHAKKVDSRGSANTSDPKVTKPASVPVSQPGNDIIYGLSDADDNINNNVDPTTGIMTPHNASSRQTPQRTFRTGSPAGNVQSNSPRGYRGGGSTGGPRNSGSRSGGSATHRHSH